MEYFLIIFGAFAIFIGFMALGLFFGRSSLQGSCGGLGKVLGIKCEHCQNKEVAAADDTTSHHVDANSRPIFKNWSERRPQHPNSCHQDL